MDKIKEITKKNISREAFIDQNCTICLEEFSKEELEKLEKMQKDNKDSEESKKKEEAENIINENIKNNLNNFKQETELINISQNENEVRRRNSNFENERLLNENKNKEKNENNNEKEKDNKFIAKLNCGHIFHSDCIDQWMSKKDSCPLCKKRLDENSNTYYSKGDSTTNQNNQSNSLSNSYIQTIFYPMMNI